jgi:hypothetical protein
MTAELPEQLAPVDEQPGIRPWMRAQVWHELAEGRMTRAQIARKYRVDRAVITRFAQRWSAEVDAARERLDDQYAGLWSAQKVNRIMALQCEYEAALRGRNASHHEWIGKRIAILRAIADELGQIPHRMQAQVSAVVEHHLVGIDLDQAFPLMTGQAGLDAELHAIVEARQ